MDILFINSPSVKSLDFQFTKYDSWITENIDYVQFKAQIPHHELMNIMSNTDITLYITNTECSPMIALESLGLGIPCLVGPTSDLFADDNYLKDMLTVNRVDCPNTIADAIERVINNYSEVKAKIPNFIKKYNENAFMLKSNLLNDIVLTQEESIFTHIYNIVKAVEL